MNTPHNPSSVMHQSRQDQIEVAIVLLKAGATVDAVSKTTALSKAMINEIIIREDLVKPWKIRKQLREAERELKMELVYLKYIAVGLMSIGMLGAALAIGNIFSSLLNSIARNPSAAEQLQRMAFIGAGLAEALGLFAFVIAILLIW